MPHKFHIYLIVVILRAHGNHVEENRIEDLVTVSDVIRHEENHLRATVARSLGIANCDT